MINDIPFLTNESRSKIDKMKKIPLQHNLLNNNLADLLDQIKNSFTKQISMTLKKPVLIYHLQKIFTDFDKDFNEINDSKFQQDISQMDNVVSIELNINEQLIKVNFLSQKNDVGYIASILHAIHTFCHTFPYHYHGLVINICLDDNKRKLVFPKKMNYPEIYKHLHKESTALNVAGLTHRFRKDILLTKKEEIIKLLFHELVHLIGLDAVLTNLPYEVTWAIDNNKLNISEAYAEWMAIILNSAYISIHLSSIYPNLNINELYQYILNAETEYSIYLTAKILFFLGYNANNFKNFFYQTNPKHKMPILIWEYLFLRTQMLLNITNIANIVQPNWYITNNNINLLVKNLEIDNDYLNKLSIAMNNLVLFDNISFTLIDIDWNLI